MSGWVAGAVVVGGVASAAISANAASSAANTQANAANNAANASLNATQQSNALQWAQYQQSNVNQSPYMQGGQEGYSALLGAMGLGAPTAYGGPSQTSIMPTNGTTNAPGAATVGSPSTGLNPGMATTQQVSNNGTVAPGNQVMTPGGGTSGAPLASPVAAPGGTNATAQGVAVNGPANVGTSATVNTNGAGPTVPGIGSVAPTNYGATQGQLNSANGAFSGQLAQQFNNSDLNAQLAPNYQFQLQQGEQALKASMAATGTLQTGQGLKNINDYAQNQASGAYQNAFNNWNTQQNQLYSRLQGIVAPGSAAATSQSNNAVSSGSNIAQTTMAGTAASNNYLTGAAAANAAGTVGAANAISGGIGSGINGYMNAGIYNKYINGGTTPSGITPGSGSASSGYPTDAAGNLVYD